MTVIKNNDNQKPECVCSLHKIACEIANCVTDETINIVNGIIKLELGKYPTEYKLFDVLKRQSTFKYSSGAFVNADLTLIDAVLVPSIFKCTCVMITDTMVTAVKEELLLAGRIDRTYCIDSDYSLSVDTEKGENIKESDVETVTAEYTDVAISRIAEEMQNHRVKPGERIELVFDLYIFECTCVAFINDDCTTLKSMNLHLG